MIGHHLKETWFTSVVSVLNLIQCMPGTTYCAPCWWLWDILCPILVTFASQVLETEWMNNLRDRESADQPPTVLFQQFCTCSPAMVLDIFQPCVTSITIRWQTWFTETSQIITVTCPYYYQSYTSKHPAPFPAKNTHTCKRVYTHTHTQNIHSHLVLSLFCFVFENQSNKINNGWYVWLVADFVSSILYKIETPITKLKLPSNLHFTCPIKESDQ